MHLMRCLAYIQARWQVSVVAEHIPGIHNNLADALSRDKLSTFHSLFPQANSQPTPIPEAIMDLTRPDWTVEHVVEQYFSAGLAASSQKTYSAGWKHYLEFCSNFSVDLLPLQEQTLCQYIAVLVSRNLTAGSINYLQYENCTGGKDPKLADMPCLTQMLRGIKTTQTSRQPASAQQQLPVLQKFYKWLKSHGKWNH